MRVDTVYERLRELSREKGVSAGELAQDLALARSNVSADLNDLVEAGRAVKEGTRPVLYQAVADGAAASSGRQPYSADAFIFFAAGASSLGNAIESAKASVLYPPKGIPVLILGETGVGKSSFAERIHRFAVDMQCVPASAPFVVFNCADYASNPALLFSQLFGTRKGAYTGADNDKAGLIERANGGYLFLDEVHRLPPEGQEMLFLFMDRGVFRRLGDSENERSAEVRLIAATTESPESALLRTFTRRFPMKIELPNLQQRNIDDRWDLLKQFFYDESGRIGKPIHVTLNAVRSLLSYQCPGNIGQFKTDIQMICAKAYTDFVSRKRDSLQIISADLPVHMRTGILEGPNYRQFWKRLANVTKRFFTFGGESSEDLFAPDGDESSIYGIIERRIIELRRLGVESSEVTRYLDDEITGYFSRYYDALHKNIYAPIGLVADQKIVAIIRRIEALVESRLDRRIDPPLRNAIAIHLQNAIEGVGRRPAAASDFESIRVKHPAEFHVAVEGLKIVERELNVSLPIEEVGFLAMFFVLQSTDGVHPGPRVRVVVLAHGDAIASALANTSNRLLGTNYAVGLDSSLKQTPGEYLAQVETFLRENNPGQPVLLLVDMGSLNNFGADLERSLGVAIQTVPLVSTLHVLQASRKAMLGLPLETVYRETLAVSPGHQPAAPPELPPAAVAVVPAQPRWVVLIGDGSSEAAQQIRQRLLGTLEFPADGIEIRIVDAPSADGIVEQLRVLRQRGKILCIASDGELAGAEPKLALRRLVRPEGLAELQKIVDQELLFDRIAAAYSTHLKGVRAAAVFAKVREFVAAVECAVGRRLNEGVLVGVACHLACAVSRSVCKETARSFPNADAFALGHRDVLAVVAANASILADPFDITLSLDEQCHIASFFDEDNCDR